MKRVAFRFSLAIGAWFAGLAAAAEAPTSLEVLTRAVSYRSIGGSPETVQLAEYFRDVLLAAGFEPQDVRIGTVPSGSASVPTLTARFKGKDRARKPLLLIGHMDVVDARREDWVRDPFTTTTENGFIYGRGVWDNKFDVSVMVATLAKLKRAGWKPARDVVLALSGDEETLQESTRALVEEFKGAELALNADAGGGYLREEDGKPGYYTIQVAEKSYADFTIEATDPGGHSSFPTDTNAIARVARALAKIDAHRFPVEFNDLTRQSFATAAPTYDGEVRDAMLRFARDPEDEVAASVLSKNREFFGQIRTTCAVTQVEGGHAPNALPQRATANINCRLFPGTTVERMRSELEAIISDPSVRITLGVHDTVKSLVPPFRRDVMTAVSGIVTRAMGPLPVIPVMSLSASDGLYYNAAGVPTYGVSGLFIRSSDDFTHGLDERVPSDSLPYAERHWEALIRELGR